MGRKKIEIRPLVDERNRNVTFLKRKAGLMKKAWELSVLCAADVSILIFANNGKPYEFSSRELDGELDRYLEYEGMIERRRAPEFAAAAAAGEDDDDDEDETDRRGSIKGKQGGPPGPGKSLKGKESFKARQPSRSDYAKAKRRRKDRGHDASERRGFIEGLVSHPSSDEEDEKPMPNGHDRPRHDDMSMQYAMNLHQSSSSSYPPQSAARLQYTPANYREQPLQPSYSAYNPSSGYPSQQQSQAPYQSYAPPASQPPSNSFMPNNMQWDQDMLSRYAEFQLQQNHQRQQRILLERQRHQLAELGIPVDDTGLLDQLFAGSVPPPPPQQASSQGTPQDEPDAGSGFVWPSMSSGGRPAANHGGHAHTSRSGMPPTDPAPAPNGMLEHLYTMGRSDAAAREGDETGFAWPTGGGQAFLPSPDSAEGIHSADKKRPASPYYGGADDKRSRMVF